MSQSESPSVGLECQERTEAQKGFPFKRTQAALKAPCQMAYLNRLRDMVHYMSKWTCQISRSIFFIDLDVVLQLLL
jgi:hypothetical protein